MDVRNKKYKILHRERIPGNKFHKFNEWEDASTYYPHIVKGFLEMLGKRVVHEFKKGAVFSLRVSVSITCWAYDSLSLTRLGASMLSLLSGIAGASSTRFRLLHETVVMQSHSGNLSSF